MQKETPVDALEALHAPTELSETHIEPPSLLSLPTDPDVLLRAAEVPSYVGIAQQTLSKWRHEGHPPRFVRLGRRIFYRSGDLREWIRDQIHENTIIRN